MKQTRKETKRMLNSMLDACFDKDADATMIVVFVENGQMMVHAMHMQETQVYATLDAAARYVLDSIKPKGVPLQ